MFNSPVVSINNAKADGTVRCSKDSIAESSEWLVSCLNGEPDNAAVPCPRRTCRRRERLPVDFGRNATTHRKFNHDATRMAHSPRKSWPDRPKEGSQTLWPALSNSSKIQSESNRDCPGGLARQPRVSLRWMTCGSCIPSGSSLAWIERQHAASHSKRCQRGLQHRPKKFEKFSVESRKNFKRK